MHPPRDSVVTTITVLALLLFILAGSVYAFVKFDGYQRSILQSNEAVIRELKEHRQDADQWKREIRRWMVEHEARKRDQEPENR